MRRTLALALLVVVMASPLAARVGPPPARPKEPSPRLMKLRTVMYDRRPSAVLKAWAPQAPAKKGEKAKRDEIDRELDALKRQVTLGQWAAVKAYFAKLDEDEGKAGYEQMLRSLAQGPVPMRPGMPGGPEMMEGGLMPGGAGPGGAMAYAEKNQFSPDDLVGIAGCAPVKLEKSHLNLLGTITRQAVAGSTVVEAVVRRFRQEAGQAKGGALTARQAARVLVQAGEADQAGGLLPPLGEARQAKDLEGLNLLARHYLARHGKEGKLTLLEQAWEATQSALSVTVTPETVAEQEEALTRAVELAPKLTEKVGQAWLDASFAKEANRGMLILATIGTLSSQGLQMQAQDAATRHKVLRLQKTAVEALLKAAPERAAGWRDTLSLLAGNWQREGDVSHRFAENNKARMKRDRYGNIFWYDEEFMFGRRMVNPNQPKPIDLTDVLEVRPGKGWLAAVRDDLRPKLAITICQLHLKADEEGDAFPYIEELSRTHPGQAKELAKEFLRVWTTNHDMNESRRRTNPYYYMYGFERRADGIPLTRSKQERNLVELSGWVARLRKLPVGEIDEELLAKAFTACHSSAEVYRSEAIEKVFGPVGGLKPKTLAGLAQKMRENLAGVWRQPAEQQAKKTNRKTKDIQQEVARGYAVGRQTVEDALKKYPDDWSLVLARAALMHDEVSFEQEVKKSTSFAGRRAATYAEFARAARLYAAKARALPEDEQSTKAFEQWFYASLGAVDLGQVNEEKVPDEKQPPLIRAALLALPGELAEKHLERFAHTLFNRMSGVRPQIKFRYLKGGFAIVGDHKAATEAKKVYDYYKDLVTEIQLVTRVDGDAKVGHKKPFGVYVLIRHTRDIERESGGFGRYLQNQNTSTYFSWNYGRPTADYRDRFTEAAKNALKENFEVLSVTFETDKVHSRAEKEYGWRVTPYAYLLLKARGPQVDHVPPLRLDLDFLDTSGYVVLPVESPKVMVDARPEKGAERPAKNVKITQILDERQANEGKLIVEVKAAADGLVPELDALLDLRPEGFRVVKADDQGVSVSRFQPDSENVTVGSERTWLVTLEATTPTAPKSFRFGSAKVGGAKMTYQRYDDADLAAASEVVDLEATYAKASRAWVWWAAGGGAAALLLAGVAVAWLTRPRKAAAGKWQLPAALTPFSAIALLERIRDEGGLDEPQRGEIARAIERVERHYFGATNGEAVDLREVAGAWVARAR